MHLLLIKVNAFKTYFYLPERIDFSMHGEHTPTMKTENTPLLDARNAAGLTQKQLAEALGIDQGHLSRIERNRCQPKPELATQIVAQFPKALDELMVLYPDRYMGANKKVKGKKK